MTIDVFTAITLVTIGYLLRMVTERRKPPKGKALVMEAVKFQPEQVTKIDPERWEAQEWLHMNGSSWLFAYPVKAEKVYRAAWHVVYLDKPFSKPYITNAEIMTRVEFEAVRDYMLNRQWIDWKNPQQHRAGLEWVNDGLRVMTAAGRLYRPTRPEVELLRLRNWQGRCKPTNMTNRGGLYA